MSTPLQKLLADVVEVCGGSRQLIKVLNRLGCTCSSDTHDQTVAEGQRMKSIWSDLQSDTLTIASTDNFDVLQTYAAVYHGDQNRSYHGTTIQLVQPRPSIKLPLTTSTICIDEHEHEGSTVPTLAPHVHCTSTSTASLGNTQTVHTSYRLPLTSVLPHTHTELPSIVSLRDSTLTRGIPHTDTRLPLTRLVRGSLVSV